MNITKKQMLVSSVAVVALMAGGVGVTAHHHAKVEADKLAHMEKQTHDKLIKDAKAATQKAEGFKDEADVKTAEKAIQRLDKKDQTALTARLKVVKDNWTVAHKAEQAVIKAEKNKTEVDVKNAQKAIDQLKATMTKAKKSALQHRLDKVKQAMKATKAKAEKAQQAQAEAQAQIQTQASVQSQNTPTSNATENTGAQSADTNSAPAPTYNQAPAYSAPAAQAPSAPQAQPAPSYNAPAPSAPAGGTASAPAQSSTNTGNSAYNSGAGANANPNVSAEELGKDIENANKGINNGAADAGW